MQVTVSESSVTVQRPSGSRRMRNESDFWYTLRNLLRELGMDVIKRNPQRDGQLTSAPYYLRERKWKYYIHDGDYMLRNLAQAYNSGAEVVLEYIVE